MNLKAAHLAFDPFTATLKEAQAIEKELLAGNAGPLVRGPVLRAGGVHQLIEDRAYYEANPLVGMAHCAVYELIAPEWLARAYLKGFYAVVNCHLGSWDEAFGRPVPKGRQLAAMRRDRSRRTEVWLLMIDYTERFPDKPLERLWEAFDVGHAVAKREALEIDAEFAKRARAVGCGSTVAQRLYAEACRQLGFGAVEVRQRLGWPAHSHCVPAKFRKVAGRKVRGKA